LKKEEQYDPSCKRNAQRHPDIESIVIECTIIQPYSKAIHQATGLPVYNITTLAKLVYAVIDPPEYLAA